MTATIEMLQLEIYANTKRALDSMVKNCLKLQKEAKKHKLNKSSKYVWIREFCQVNFFCGRRSGLTTAMIEVGLFHFDNPLFVFNSELMGKYARAMTDKEINYTTPNRFECITEGQSFDAIFFDSVVDLPQSLYPISELMVSRNDKFLLGFLGT